MAFVVYVQSITNSLLTAKQLPWPGTLGHKNAQHRKSQRSSTTSASCKICFCWLTINGVLNVVDKGYHCCLSYVAAPLDFVERTFPLLSHVICYKSLSVQGAVTYIPAVLTPATGIKVRSSGQALKLVTIKRSRRLFTLLDQGQDGVCPRTLPIPRLFPVGDQGSRLF